MSALNRARREHGLPALRYSDSLHRAARAHSMDMVRRGYFAHGPFARRLSAFGVRAPLVGDVLARVERGERDELRHEKLAELRVLMEE